VVVSKQALNHTATTHGVQAAAVCCHRSHQTAATVFCQYGRAPERCSFKRGFPALSAGTNNGRSAASAAVTTLKTHTHTHTQTNKSMSNSKHSATSCSRPRKAALLFLSMTCLQTNKGSKSCNTQLKQLYSSFTAELMGKPPWIVQPTGC